MSNEPTRRLPIALLIGMLGLAIPLVAGRWGTYIGASPVFISDALPFMGVLLSLAPSGSSGARLNFPVSFGVLCTGPILVVLQAVLRGHGDLVTRIRHMLPLVNTTIAIESINFQLRKITKTREHFPSDEAAMKLLYFGLRNISSKRGGESGTGTTHGWKHP